MAILIAAQSAYIDVIPGWATRVRAANATCVVGGAFSGASGCKVAKRAGCQCIAIEGAKRAQNGPRWGQERPGRRQNEAKMGPERGL